MNHGNLTEEIIVSRGCRQGAPCSPYYFLICAELMAIKLRNNQKIEGFNLRDFKKLFGQYADDMDLYCKPTQKNIDNIQAELSAFCKISGCAINYEKTTIYRISQDNEALAHIYTRGMRVEKTKINVLGIWINRNPQEMLKLNYADMGGIINWILNNWANRQLDLLAKITVINTLIASLFVYKMYVLPLMPQSLIQRFNSIIEKFLWNGRKPKIPLKKLQNKKQYGGANLVNLEHKDKALKVSWVAYLLKNESDLLSEMAYQNINRILQEKVWQCNINSKDIKQMFDKDKFWIQVWESWSYVNYSDNVDKSQMIWYNSHVRINNKPFVWRKPFKQGLLYINQLFKENTNRYVTCSEAQERFLLDVMQYNSLISALKKLTFTKPDPTRIILTEKIMTCKNVTSFIYNELTSDSTSQYNTFIRWQFRLKTSILYDDFLKLMVNINKITNSTKLRSFQYRLLNLSLVLNVQLKTWKICDTDKCSFCNTETETLEHIFFDCPKTKVLLNSIQSILISYQPDTKEYNLTKENILFNNVDVNPGSLVNCIVLIMKQMIYANRCLKKRITVQQLKEKIEFTRKVELYNTKQNNKCRIYYCKWYNMTQDKLGNHAQEYISEYLYNVTIYDNIPL